MKKYIKIVVATALLGSLFTSCDDPKTDLPPLKEIIFSENFEDLPSGSGSNEVNISGNGWSNYNLTATRKWQCVFTGGNHAEFSSYYSATGTSDEVWLISPKLDFTNATNETLSFETTTGYSNGAELKVLYSTDFNESQAGISTATWHELNPTLPTADQIVTKSGYLDLSAAEGNSVYVAFKYIGSKANSKTTTFKIDNVNIFMNK